MTVTVDIVKPSEATIRVIRSILMRKDTRLSFRVGSDLKKTLEAIAAAEGRSVAQVCEAFLKVGSENYKREGNKILQQALAKALVSARHSSNKNRL
jgi:hypothetical protein